jgi:hypothetical protein
VELIRGEGAEVELNDLRVIGDSLPNRVRFQGTLQEPQVKTFEVLLPHEHGVLAATTAFGKTVVAAALIAQRGRNALVLVHRRELLTQWVERLRTFLDIDPKDIGVIGGGRRKPTGVISSHCAGLAGDRRGLCAFRPQVCRGAGGAPGLLRLCRRRHSRRLAGCLGRVARGLS